MPSDASRSDRAFPSSSHRRHRLASPLDPMRCRHPLGLRLAQRAAKRIVGTRGNATLPRRCRQRGAGGTLWGAALREVIYLTISTGVGSGIITDGGWCQVRGRAGRAHHRNGRWRVQLRQQLRGGLRCGHGHRQLRPGAVECRRQGQCALVDGDLAQVPPHHQPGCARARWRGHSAWNITWYQHRQPTLPVQPHMIVLGGSVKSGDLLMSAMWQAIHTLANPLMSRVDHRAGRWAMT